MTKTDGYSPTALAIAQRMSDLGLTQGDVAKAVDRSQSWVSQSLLGNAERTLRRLIVNQSADLDNLLKALEWDLPELVRRTKLDLPVPQHDQRITAGQYVEVPLTRRVEVYPAGTGPAWDLEEALDTLWLPADLFPDKRMIGLKAMGDSMSPYLPVGAIAVIVHDDGMVEPGDYCGVRMADDGVVVKRFVRELEHGELLLESLNPGKGEQRLFTAPLGSRIIGPVVRRVLDGQD